MSVDGELHASLVVKNTGPLRGTETVQLYAADTATGVTLPAQQLIGFARVELGAGESRNVSFVVPLTLLGYVCMFGEFVMEPGPVDLSVGSSSSDMRATAKLNVLGRTRVIRATNAHSCRGRR